MSKASPLKATLASDGPQPAAETKTQPDQKTSKVTREELHVFFEAAAKRASEMTTEEIMKKYSWGPEIGVGSDKAMQALEEIEAPNAGSDDDDRDATERGPLKTSTKQKN